MIEEQGRIVAVESDCLWVETVEKSTCGSCAAEKGCGTSTLSKYLGKTNFIRVLLEGRESKHYAVGDSVTIGIPEDVLVKSSLFVYLLPLVMMVFGAILGEAWFVTDLATLIGLVVGLGLGAVIVRVHAFLHRDDRRVQPILIDGQELVSIIDPSVVGR